MLSGKIGQELIARRHPGAVLDDLCDLFFIYSQVNGVIEIEDQTRVDTLQPSLKRQDPVFRDEGAVHHHHVIAAG